MTITADHLYKMLTEQTNFFSIRQINPLSKEYLIETVAVEIEIRDEQILIFADNVIYIINRYQSFEIISSDIVNTGEYVIRFFEKSYLTF